MTSVDEAYQRYFYLTDALGRLYRASISKPISEENIRLGLTRTGDTLVQAKTKITQRLDTTQARLAELALIDMCSAFESECLRRIPTAVGEAKRVLTEHYNVPVMSQITNQLVRQAEDFGSLDALFKAVESRLRPEVGAQLRDLKNERNRIAHGTKSPPKNIQLEDARELLNAVLELIC
ncbi:hypothetical protein [Acidisoma cladoniae]|uniref:hypothetical protein n=1 Tax=Acidisoma cladoniae TaxID=3040935 RepID=UPI00254DDE03|nr:hypothetical protein [Acidisoma sp. PAMC 29798]